MSQQSYRPRASRFGKIRFSEMELKVIRLLCEGYSSPEISKKLYRSRRTIEGYRARILEKTDARNAVGIALFAVKNGIFELN